LGRQLLAFLDDEPDVSRVVGIDVVEPDAGSPKLEFHLLDVRDARLAKVLPGVDTVVHLAFVVDPMRDEALMRRINIDGTRNLLEAAGSGKLVYASTATVY